MGFTTDDAMVRVDFFKESGKWYTTEAVKWVGYDDPDIYEAFANSLKQHLAYPDGRLRLSGMFACCLEPAHIRPIPLMLKVE